MRKQVHLDTGMGTLRVISSVRHTHTEMWRWWLWVPVSRSGQVYSIFQQDHWRIMGSKSDMITTWSPHTFKFNRMQNKTSLFCLHQQKQIFFQSVSLPKINRTTSEKICMHTYAHTRAHTLLLLYNLSNLYVEAGADRLRLWSSEASVSLYFLLWPLVWIPGHRQTFFFLLVNFTCEWASCQRHRTWNFCFVESARL